MTSLKATNYSMHFNDTAKIILEDHHSSVYAKCLEHYNSLDTDSPASTASFISYLLKDQERAYTEIKACLVEVQYATTSATMAQTAIDVNLTLAKRDNHITSLKPSLDSFTAELRRAKFNSANLLPNFEEITQRAELAESKNREMNIAAALTKVISSTKNTGNQSNKRGGSGRPSFRNFSRAPKPKSSAPQADKPNTQGDANQSFRGGRGRGRATFRGRGRGGRGGRGRGNQK